LNSLDLLGLPDGVSSKSWITRHGFPVHRTQPTALTYYPLRQSTTVKPSHSNVTYKIPPNPPLESLRATHLVVLVCCLAITRLVHFASIASVHQVLWIENPVSVGALWQLIHRKAGARKRASKHPLTHPPFHTSVIVDVRTLVPCNIGRIGTLDKITKDSEAAWRHPCENHRLQIESVRCLIAN
jgi:hypothetical protein